MIRERKVVIFDLDGTLINSMGIWNKIDKELIRKIANENIVKIDDIQIGIERDEKLREYSKCKDAYLEYCGYLKEKYNSKITKQEIKKLRYKIADYYLKNVIDYKPDVPKVLNFLKEKGFILVIASTTNENTMEIYRKENKNIIKKAPIDDYFSLIYDKSSVTNIKPDPEVHYKILDTSKVNKEECLILEDSLIGVEAANNAGIDVAVIYDKYSDQNRDRINKLPNRPFTDFKEFYDLIKKEFSE